MEQWLTWNEDFPYNTMSPDWDIHQAITSTLRLFPTLPALEHVKGHQDTPGTDLATLPLPVKMNIEADRLAAAFRYPLGLSCSISPLISGNTACLHGPTGTISSNYRQILQQLCSDPVLKQYLCEHNKWSDAQFHSMAWAIHGQVVWTYFTQCHFLIKYLHGWLPLDIMQQHYATHYSATCPACAYECKDREHFLRCPQSSAWRGRLFEALTTMWHQQHVNVNPTLQHVLLDELRSWLQGTECIHPPLGPQFARVVHLQRQVGIAQLFYGRFVREWTTLQDSYLSSHSLSTSRISGRSFVAQTISVIWDHVHQLWLTRNQHKHGSTAATQEIQAVHLAQAEIRDLYAVKPLVQPRDRDVFYATPEIHFEREPTSAGLCRWLTTWKPVIYAVSSEQK